MVTVEGEKRKLVLSTVTTTSSCMMDWSPDEPTAENANSSTATRAQNLNPIPAYDSYSFLSPGSSLRYSTNSYSLPS